MRAGIYISCRQRLDEHCVLLMIRPIHSAKYAQKGGYRIKSGTDKSHHLSSLSNAFIVCLCVSFFIPETVFPAHYRCAKGYD